MKGLHGYQQLFVSEFFELFMENSTFGYRLFPGDVTRLPFHYDGVYTKVYAGFVQRCFGKRAGFLVENLNFSTFSTGFSTKVFHSPYSVEYAVSVYINVFEVGENSSTFLRN